MEEIVLNTVDNLTHYKKLILDLSNNFNFVSFYKNEYDIETAIGLVTKKQALFVPCFLTNSDNHGKNFQILYDTVFYPFKEINSNSTKSWQKYVVEDGNIAIQMDVFGDFYLWLPDKIDDYQYKELKKIDEILQNMKKESCLQNIFFDVHAWIITSMDSMILFELDNNDLSNLFNYYDNTKKEEIIHK